MSGRTPRRTRSALPAYLRRRSFPNPRRPLQPTIFQRVERGLLAFLSGMHARESPCHFIACAM